ncbi:hypothetical protein C8F04DRAFT_1262089 [Mycena alexandri]|uniref:Uncharacterized protein n=1 Tax=Mycena alexandri TaxID=1745969 RepID=A0AAD6X1I4_9AGAR|nr:hypothetical protein C8F04DRAFT_1262089 [Mycena alexandri]
MATGAEIGAALSGAIKIASWGFEKFKRHTVEGQVKRGQFYLDLAVERINDPKEELQLPGATRQQARDFHKDAKNHWHAVRNASDRLVYVVRLRSQQYALSLLESLPAANGKSKNASAVVVIAPIHEATVLENFHEVEPEMRQEFDRITRQLDAEKESIASRSGVLTINANFQEELAFLRQTTSCTEIDGTSLMATAGSESSHEADDSSLTALAVRRIL